MHSPLSTLRASWVASKPGDVYPPDPCLDRVVAVAAWSPGSTSHHRCDRRHSQARAVPAMLKRFRTEPLLGGAVPPPRRP
jgi:pyridoxine 5'-phosphate synthase PdxJ